jgi:imidazolonepropionase-like amidohydrolase
MPRRSILLFVLLAVLPAPLAAQTPPAVAAFTNVTVIPMDRDRAVAGQTVIVRNGRIAAIGPVRTTSVPDGAQRIDGTGQFLMPGLADMHVHIFSSDELVFYLANGVTTVRNMWGMPMHLRMRDSIRAGQLLGPTVYTAGAILDGDPPQLRGSAVIRTASDADTIVQQQLRDGYDFIKVYNRLTPDAYAGIAAAARRHGARFVGHVPTAVALRAALDAGQSSIEHLSGYAAAALTTDTGAANWSRTLEPSKIRSLATETRAAGVWNTPTLTVLERGDMSAAESKSVLDRVEVHLLPPMIRRFCCSQAYDAKNDLAADLLARRRANRFAVVRALRDAGARLLLGTDTGNPFVLPGYAAMDELQLMVEAGLSPFEALRAGTEGPAEFLGQSSTSGSVEVGKVADLVLTHGNPLRDVRAVRNVSGVMVRGRWLSAEELNSRIRANAAKIASPPPR